MLSPSLSDQRRNMLFSYYVTVFSDVKRQVNVNIFIDDGSAVTLDGVPVIDQFLKVSPDRFLGDIIDLAQLAHNNSSVGLQFFKYLISSLYR